MSQLVMIVGKHRGENKRLACGKKGKRKKKEQEMRAL